MNEGQPRTEPMPALDDEALAEFFSTRAQSCRWKDRPETVLGHVDFLLRAHGLEVVLFDTRDDSVGFKIEARR